MSKATKRKHVTKEVQQECLTLPKETESIVQVILSKGNNLHEVMDAAGEHYLVSMPVKFRKNIWVMRGNYVLVEAIPEGDKVKAEIVKILTKDHIKYFRGQNCWPKKFDQELSSLPDGEISKQDENNLSTSENEDDLFVNTNRQPYRNNDETSSDSSSSDPSDSD